MKVAVFGARGRMGAEVVRAVEATDDLHLVAAVDVGDDRAAVENADVVVDFTHPDAVLGNIDWCLQRGIAVVVGTSGFDGAKLDAVRAAMAPHPKAQVLVAPNFSIGGVLMMRFAELAAPFYESVEVIELHHPNKVDAPSGTALNTATRIAAARASAGLDPVPDATTTDPDHFNLSTLVKFFGVDHLDSRHAGTPGNLVNHALLMFYWKANSICHRANVSGKLQIAILRSFPQ